MQEESWIEASFYNEVYEAKPKDSKRDRQLNEISRSLRPFKTEIDKIRTTLLGELQSKIGVSKDPFVDFRLGTMELLNHLSKDFPVEEFLRQAFVGCFQCILCLEDVNQVCSCCMGLLTDLGNALGVMRHVLSELGSEMPNLGSEKTQYEGSKLVHLNDLTETYIRSKRDYETLRLYKHWITGFKVASEIDYALGKLQDDFEELRASHPDEISRHHNEFALFAEMDEPFTDFSPCC